MPWITRLATDTIQIWLSPLREKSLKSLTGSSRTIPSLSTSGYSSLLVVFFRRREYYLKLAKKILMKYFAQQKPQPKISKNMLNSSQIFVCIKIASSARTLTWWPVPSLHTLVSTWVYKSSGPMTWSFWPGLRSLSSKSTILR
jgi:hypothetical protein